jgi:uncharacterized protein YdeI (YjbR/CyaY-like superfamily)
MTSRSYSQGVLRHSTAASKFGFTMGGRIPQPKIAMKPAKSATTTPNPKVDAYIKKAKTWQKEFARLRGIIARCGLTEEIKWGHPCYTQGGANIVLIHGFKEYCAILFIKGALLSDKKKLLIQQTENVQAARQLRFTNVEQISKLEKTIIAYVNEAVNAEKAGLKVEFKATKEFSVPAEFQAKLDSNQKLQKAFGALTPGRQRGYLLFFASAKQQKTREARIEKYIPQILMGKGMDD